MSQCLLGRGLCKRCRFPAEEVSESNDLSGPCPVAGCVWRDRRLQLSNDLSSRDSSQISPCNPRRHWWEAASRQAEGEEEEHLGLRRLRRSVCMLGGCTANRARLRPTRRSDNSPCLFPPRPRHHFLSPLCLFGFPILLTSSQFVPEDCRCEVGSTISDTQLQVTRVMHVISKRKLVTAPPKWCKRCSNEKQPVVRNKGTGKKLSTTLFSKSSDQG